MSSSGSLYGALNLDPGRLKNGTEAACRISGGTEVEGALIPGANGRNLGIGTSMVAKFNI